MMAACRSERFSICSELTMCRLVFARELGKPFRPGCVFGIYKRWSMTRHDSIGWKIENIDRLCIHL